MRIMGVDPGYGRTGWAVVENQGGGKLVLLEYGLIETESTDLLPKRLYKIFDQLMAISSRTMVKRMVIEKFFPGKNMTTTEGVYQARGVVLAAAGFVGLEVLEPTASQVKLATTGSGKASKEDVKIMVERLLNVKEQIKPDDVVDAIACALYGVAP
ncbi:MAG: crossover junction endodeoxyribonuclease RuvC [Leptonema sp. (in: Bacteria)]|nr:crossover junction endodeoxyribonuclease RuvC [Leptonema sp. (in: bacteria)]